MTLEIDRIAQRIARSRDADGYKLWRTQKDLDTELYQVASARQRYPTVRSCINNSAFVVSISGVAAGRVQR